MSDVPPPPEGFTVDAPTRSRSQKRRDQRRRSQDKTSASAPTTSDDSIASVHDGDTFRMVNGNALRLWGADAPELKQQGWDRQGNPVPIGQQSRNALIGDLSPQSVIGPQQGESYGRTVAPITTAGMDVGNDLLRSGNALAASEYLSGDPERRFEYTQAERLARQNRLGMHKTFHQTPQQFRQNPEYQPSREEVAQFWDTPTPLAGMRPEAEKRYLAMLNDFSVKPQQIVAFAKENGFVVDPAGIESARAQSRAGKQAIQIDYRSAPKPLTDLGDGKTGALMRGVGNGVLPNMLEEAGAIPDTFGLTSGRENVFNSDRRLADIYHNNYDQNEAITGFDRSEHPYVTGAGELVGSLVVPIGRVRSAADLAKWGAGYGLASGLGQDGTIPQRLTSGVIGAGEGAATAIVGTRALEAAAPLVSKGWRRLTGNSGKSALVAPDGLGMDIPSPPDGFTFDTPKMRAETTDGPGAGGTAEAHSSGYQSESPQHGHGDTAAVPPPPEGFALDRPIPMQSEAGASISQEVSGPARPQPIDQPLTEAQLRAAAADIAPSDVVPIPSNVVGDVEEAAAIEADRYLPAKPVNEATALESRTVKAQNGRELPKRGPLDLVTWLRTQGGLKDQGGNLRAVGIDNAPRDLDFARGEQRFGKLIDDANGMTLDDAAMKAWEAGYLPGNERPDINTLLEAIDRTHSGAERYYHPNDLAEVEQFHGMRADRQALEEQLAQGPVYNDRSVAAGEDRPLPPIEAYEEWPAGGPDFAGNINLNKLESPQDISRALSFTEKRVGFDPATRGRVAQAETERLASELGMTPDSLLARRKGQAFNAEEALAARQILAKSGNELVNAAKRVQSLENPGDDVMAEFRQKWMRHAAIQEQVSGMTAEAGRALQQFRILARSRAVPRDVLLSLVGSGGGAERIKDAANTILDAVEAGPGVFNTVVEKAAKPKFRDKLVEVYINSLLSGPQTHVVNMVSNTLTALAQLPEHATAAVLGKGRQVLPKADPDRVLVSEVGRRAFGMIQGAAEGARFFAHSLKTGEPVDLVSKVENQSMKAVSGIKGEIVRLPTRFLTAEDEFFKGVARRSEIWGLAARQARAEGLRGQAASKRIAELAQNPPDAMLSRAMDYARYVTFQQKLGPAGSKISGLTQDLPALKLFLPFVRTPTNLLKFAVERSPAAPLLKEWRADFTAGGARRDLAIAKAILGTGLAMAVYQGALNGKITGSAPTDPAKSRLMYADGWQPYSIRVGDKWVSYKRLDPISTTIGTAADLALLPEGMSKRQQDDKATLLIASIMGNLASKTWLSGISDVVGALTEPDQKADNLMQRLAGSLAVPSGVAQVARTMDPVQRQVDTTSEAVQARIPGLSNSLLPRRDIWGEEVRSEGGIGPDIISPAYVKTAHDDPVNSELLKAGISVGMVPSKVGGQDLTPAQHDRYQQMAGRRSHAALTELVNSPGWPMLDDDAKKDLVEKTVKRARAETRAQLFGGKPDQEAESPRKGSAAPPPPGFKVEGEAGGRNVYADLLRVIPGLTADNLTSGFRTPEYQADMKRRGYHPADNSGHLDGSSFDIVPPPGKSIGWLGAQVKRYDPKARLLPEGDHLHVTFPGYFGAPPLGGARGAGLKNPLAGMPPPPPGFTVEAR